MAITDRELIVKMSVDSASYRKGMEECKKQAAELGKELKELRETGMHALEAFGAVEAVAKLKEMVMSSVELAENMGKMAQKTGVSTEELSRLSYAANLADVSTDALSIGLKKLAKNATDAASGSKEQAAHFQAIGVATKDAHGKIRPLDELLGDVAEKFAGYEDGAAKSALAQQIFGKAGADLIPLLNMGRDGLREMGDEAKRLGVIISGEQAERAERFNDTLKKIGEHSKASALALTDLLLPSLQRLASELDAFNQHGNKLLSVFTILAKIGGIEGGVTGDLKNAFSEASVGALMSGAGALLSGDSQVAKKFAEQFYALGVMGGQQIIKGMAANFRMVDLWSMVNPDGWFFGEKEGGKKKAPPIGHASKDHNDSLKQLMSELENARRELSKESLKGAPDEKFQEALASFTDGKGAQLMGALKPSEKQSGAEMLRQLLAYKQAEDENRAIIERTEKVQREYNAAREEGARVTLEARTDTEKYSDTVERLTDLFDRGFIRTQEAYNRSVREAHPLMSEAKSLMEEHRAPIEALSVRMAHLDEMYKANLIDMSIYWEEARKAQQKFEADASALRDDVKPIADATAGVLARSLQEGFKRGLRGMLMDFADMIRQMAAQRAAAGIVGGIFSALGFGAAAEVTSTSAISGAVATSGVDATALGAAGWGGFVPAGIHAAAPRPVSGSSTAALTAGQQVVRHVHSFDALASRRTLDDWYHATLADRAARR